MSFDISYSDKFARKTVIQLQYSASGTKDVTVILFGWAGCKDRYLAKYSAIYEQAGYGNRHDTVYRRLVFLPLLLPRCVITRDCERVHVV